MAWQVQLRQDAAADLVSATPVEGEPGYDRTNKRLLVGDGVRAEGVPHASYRDVQNQTFAFATAGGTADALTLDITDGTLDYNPAAYVTGQRFTFKAASDNTGSATLNVNSLGSKTIKKNAGADDLAGGDIVAGGIYTVVYDGTVFQLSGGLGGGGGGGAVLIVADEKSNNTQGGTFNNGAWRTRDLNTVRQNGIDGASLSSNQITLPAGDYIVFASAPARAVNGHQTRLQDTGGTTLVIGTSEDASSGNQVQNRSVVHGAFTLASSATVELQHRCVTSVSNTGFGNVAAFGNNEVYSVVEIRKV
jgi:hypothetical protein